MNDKHIIFFSYAQGDYKDEETTFFDRVDLFNFLSVIFKFKKDSDKKFFSWFREQLQGDVRYKSGKLVEIFFDREDVRWGQRWEFILQERLKKSIFLIAVITPDYINSKNCNDEYMCFVEREKNIGKNDLILPVYFMKDKRLHRRLKGKKITPEIPLIEDMASRSFIDWTSLRINWFDAEIWPDLVGQLSDEICKRLNEESSLLENLSDDYIEYCLNKENENVDKFDIIEEHYLMCSDTQSHVIQILYKSVEGKMFIDDLYELIISCYGSDTIGSSDELYFRVKDLERKGLVEIDRITNRKTLVILPSSVSYAIMRRKLSDS